MAPASDSEAAHSTRITSTQGNLAANRDIMSVVPAAILAKLYSLEPKTRRRISQRSHSSTDPRTTGGAVVDRCTSLASLFREIIEWRDAAARTQFIVLLPHIIAYLERHPPPNLGRSEDMPQAPTPDPQPRQLIVRSHT
jgi:hypothetical protein